MLGYAWIPHSITSRLKPCGCMILAPVHAMLASIIGPQHGAGIDAYKILTMVWESSRLTDAMS